MRPKQNFLAWMKTVKFAERQTLYSKIRTLSHLWNRMVAILWSGPVLLPLSKDDLPLIDEMKNSELNQKIWIEKCQGIHLWTETQEKLLMQ